MYEETVTQLINAAETCRDRLGEINETLATLSTKVEQTDQNIQNASASLERVRRNLISVSERSEHHRRRLSKDYIVRRLLNGCNSTLLFLVLVTLFLWFWKLLFAESNVHAI